ncbi:MAG: hypothetical protein PHQ11_12340 [Paludibacter sp.]|nr:hypothetical protein [Paludibacter sp.]MDD4198588.1 hypothetical protein [Paludibacter sp.]MDD4427702.1 hypothetical protein [Paludibacter sp.]
MKKILILIPLMGFMFACTGEKKQTESANGTLEEQTEVIENSIQKVDETINASDVKMEKSQNEIDSLLNNI